MPKVGQRTGYLSRDFDLLRPTHTQKVRFTTVISFETCENYVVNPVPSSSSSCIVTWRENINFSFNNDVKCFMAITHVKFMCFLVWCQFCYTRSIICPRSATSILTVIGSCVSVCKN